MSNNANPPAVNDIGLEDPASPPPAAGSRGPVRQDSPHDDNDIGGAQMPAVQEQAPVAPQVN